MKAQIWFDPWMSRVGWSRGEWDNEPDKAQWTDAATGLPCLAKRNSMGAWCDYVGVAEGHPAFTKGYDAVRVDVHGGLTFSDFCQPGAPAETICHVPEPGEPERVWWLGFDCAHASDYAPAFEARELTRFGFNAFGKGIYRTLNYVRRECADLAAQLMAM